MFEILTNYNLQKLKIKLYIMDILADSLFLNKIFRRLDWALLIVIFIKKEILRNYNY